MAMQLRGDAPFSYATEHYLDTVYRAACHNAPTVQDAEDVTQEVFVALLRSGKSFADGEHLKAWLLRVTVNKCRNLHRAKRRTEVPLTESMPAPAGPERAGKFFSKTGLTTPVPYAIIYKHSARGQTK